jgi:hypothetical protein
MARSKTMTIGGDILKVTWNGSMWWSACGGTEHSEAVDAMREELYRYLSECGELPEGCASANDLDLTDFGEMVDSGKSNWSASHG